MRLIDIEEFEEEINKLQEYDMNGEYTDSTMEYNSPIYYRIEDVKHMLNTLKQEHE